MPTNGHNTDERVEDVLVGLNSYGNMVALFYHAGQQNPLIPFMAADWMAQLLTKLEEWGVLTPEQHEQLRFRMAEDVAARKAELTDDPERDPAQDLIAQLGI